MDQAAGSDAVAPAVEDASEYRPLRDLVTHVVARRALTHDAAAIQLFVRSLGTPSALDQMWESSVSCPAPYAAVLDNVCLVPGSRLILPDSGEALSDEMTVAYRVFGSRPKLWEMEIGEGPVLRMPALALAPGQIAAGVHLMSEHDSNYFHWIAEVLPRLFVHEHLVQDKTVPLLVTGGLHANLHELLDAVRHARRPVKVLERGERHRVGRLFYPSDLSRIIDVYDRAPGLDTTFVPVTVLAAMAASIKRAFGAASASDGTRLFIRRNAGYRKLLNEQEIEDMLARQGFRAIDPGEMPVCEQIAAFSRAEVIVGASGAALANMLWCAPACRILVLHSDHPYKKYPYWDAFARASRASIFYMSGPRARTVSGLFEAHDDYTIDAGAVMAQVAGAT